MAYAFVQQNATDSATSAATITVTLTPTAGNLLVFAVSADSADTSSIALSDNLGTHNTFTQIGTDLVTTNAQRCAWWFAANCKGGATTFTATFSTSARFRTIYVAEYSGIATTSPFLNGTRAENDNPGTGTDAVSSGNANATSQPALVWGFCIDTSGNTTPNAGTGYTSRTGVWSTATCLGRPEDKRVTATGNVAATFTATTGTDTHASGIGIFLETVPAVPSLSWSPCFQDQAPARPSVSAATAGAAVPVFTPAPAVAPPLSWSPEFPDRARPAVSAANVGGSAAPEATLSSTPAPPLSWSPEFPDLARRLPSAANVGGPAQPEATLPNPPAPPLSWSPEFPDAARARPSQAASGSAVPALPIPNPPPSIFPLSSGGRYLRKSDGTPFLLCADTTWSLFVDIPLTGVGGYFSTLVSQGFNAVSGNAIEHHYTVVKPPKERGGLLPFTQRMDGTTYTGSPNGTTGAAGTQGQFSSDNYANINNQSPDCTFINNSYWATLETILDAALASNLLVIVWPGYLGFHADDEGWMNEMVVWDAVTGAGGFTGQSFADPTKSKMWNYGAWLGARWKNYPNILWVMGGDYGSNTQTLNTQQASAVSNLMAGLKSVAGAQSVFFTAHWDRPAISTDTTLAAGAFDIIGCYADEAVAELARRGYAVSPVRPTIGLEYFYENDLFGGSAPYRKYVYWQFLGGIAGGFYGNEQLWRFDNGSPGTDWTTLLATQARLDAVRQFAFWQARPWWRLKPSGLGGMGTIVTAGGGTASPQSTDYVAAVATSEGDLALAYVPPAHTGSVTIDMTKLGAQVTARWFDPTNASFTSIGTFANTGTHAFTPPATNSAGDTDFLLVLDASGTPMPLSWSPGFPDQAQRRSLSVALVMSGGVQPVAPPPPAPPLSWSPEFPDRARSTISAANVGGENLPASQIGSPGTLLSWPAIQADAARRAPKSSDAGGETSPLPPPLDTRSLAWLPTAPDRVGRAFVVAPADATAVASTLGPPSVASWTPGIADEARRPASPFVDYSARPEISPTNPPAPPLSWSSGFPDAAVRARGAANVGGAAQPEAALPNPSVPPLSWSPGFPDLAHHSPSAANVGGPAAPDATLPNPPAPPLSWSPEFPDATHTRHAPSGAAESTTTAIVPTAASPTPPLRAVAGRGVAGVSRGSVTRLGGVSRTGGVHAAQPSPIGEWDPQWNDSVVDLDRDQLTRFIAAKGYGVIWEKAVLCPNVPGTGLAPRDHAIGCPICDERGFVYVDPVPTKMLMQGIRLNQSYYAYGRWDAGNMLVTAEPEFTIDCNDRLTLTNGVGRFTQRLVRQPGAATDVLRYSPLCVRYVAWVGRSGALVRFTQGVDFQVFADGTSLEWSGASQPDAGSFYSVCYDYRPRYVVLDLVHHHRDSPVGGVHYQFPVQAVAKLDYLVRNESSDAQQVVDRSPFE